MADPELTAGEQAYLNSGGTDTAGLIAENPAPVVEQAEAVTEHKIEADKPAAGSEAKPGEAAKVETPAAGADAPEPGEEEIPAADGKTKRRMVDSRALKAERTARAAAEAELRTERETRARIDERLKMLSEAVTSAEPVEKIEAPKIPDPEEDIIAHNRYLANRMAAIEQTLTTTQTETAEQRQRTAVVSVYRADSAAFAQKQTDFMDAYNFLLSARTAQLKGQRYSEQEIAKWLEIEEMNVVQRALEAKTSPAQDIYNLAKSMGYAPKAPEPAPNGAGSAQPAPGAAKPAAAPAGALVAPSVTEEIDRIKAGKAASMSLSNGGGGGAEEMSLEWLANAPLKEFQAFMDKPGNREKVERAMGKREAA